jgi:hypothetical protein
MRAPSDIAMDKPDVRQWSAKLATDRAQRAPELELMISHRTARPRKRYVITLAISCERHPAKMAPRMQVVVIAERQQTSWRWNAAIARGKGPSDVRANSRTHREPVP